MIMRRYKVSVNMPLTGIAVVAAAFTSGSVYKDYSLVKHRGSPLLAVRVSLTQQATY
jgi:hypothetical protein